jgi:dihydrofolate reductase
MGNLIYLTIMSLDGYIEDPQGNFDWGEPDEQEHRFINDLARAAGTYLYGRRMYETMLVWETEPGHADQSPYTAEFAEIWKAADKIVYSKTLDAVETAKTRLERAFVPDAVRQLKAKSKHDIAVGGAELASHAFRAGLVDECHLFLAPVVVGGGKHALPQGVRIHLDVLDERRFEGGMVYVRARTRTQDGTG